MSQGETKGGPERDETYGYLLLPSLLGVLVEVKGRPLCLGVVF